MFIWQTASEAPLEQGPEPLTICLTEGYTSPRSKDQAGFLPVIKFGGSLSLRPLSLSPECAGVPGPPSGLGASRKQRRGRGWPRLAFRRLAVLWSSSRWFSEWSFTR